MPSTLAGMTLQNLLMRYNVKTIAELAHKTGMSSQHAWNLWWGVTGIGRVMIERLHEKLDIPVDELLQVDPVKTPKPRGRPRKHPHDAA